MLTSLFKFFLPLLRCHLLYLLITGSISAIASADSAGAVYRSLSCPYQLQQIISQCAQAILPENRTNNSGQISLFIVQLGAGDKYPPAVVLGGGGPGSGLSLDRENGIVFWNTYRRQILGDEGKLILIDQRGSGSSQPLLNCPEEEPLFLSFLQSSLSLTQQAKKWQNVLQQCYQRLTDSGVQIEAYTTSASADDFEDIRQLLNIKQWHLIGFSYGSRLALEIIRRHPHGVASAVLESPFPYDASQLQPHYPIDTAIKRISDDCRRQKSCNRHGDVSANIMDALTRALPPISINYNSKPYSIHLSPERLFDILHTGLYDNTSVAALPFFSRQLAQGKTDNENSQYFAYYYLDFFLNGQLASMLNLHINCQENKLPETPQPPVTLLEHYEQRYQQEYMNTCRMLWRNQTPPPEIVKTNKHVLIINGLYDGATPPEWGAALAQRLPNAQRLVVHAAHTPSLYTPCLTRSIYSFFQAPSTTITAYCNDNPLIFY